jgi:hypothetical protein
MKLFLRIFISALLFVTVLGCGNSDQGSSEVKSSTSTNSDQQKRAKLYAALNKQAVARARANAQCKAIVQNALYHQALGIITSIPACVQAIQARNAAMAFLSCKDNLKLVGDLTKACLLGSASPNNQGAAPSCFDHPEVSGCEM